MERLRHIREQVGYSQQDLADESGVSQHTISEIELGRRKPQGRTLRKLAGVLGVEVRDLFEDSRPLVQAPPETAHHPTQEDADTLPASIVVRATEDVSDALRLDLERFSTGGAPSPPDLSGLFLKGYFALNGARSMIKEEGYSGDAKVSNALEHLEETVYEIEQAYAAAEQEFRPVTSLVTHLKRRAS